MTRILCVDIETIPQERYTKPATYDRVDGGEIECDAAWLDNLRLPEDGLVNLGALCGEIEAGQAVLKATGVVPALHPTTARVVSVNFGWTHGDTAKTEVRALPDFIDSTMLDALHTEATEAKLVLEALQRVRGALDKDTRIVGFHSKGFDLPMLRVRAALLRITGVPTLPWGKLLYPFDNRMHCDLRLVLSNDDRRARGTQQHWAEAFGIHSEERGAEVFQMAREGRWDDIRAYGHSEGKTLVELFKAVEPVL